MIGKLAPYSYVVHILNLLLVILIAVFIKSFYDRCAINYYEGLQQACKMTVPYNGAGKELQYQVKP